MRSEEEQFSFP